MSTYRLEVKNLHKKFPGVYAVKGVSFQVKPGEVHSLVGENGAGKSTLMKMIIGEYFPDDGQVFHNGNLMKIKSVAESQKIGIAMIHQELAPLPNMTISENIFLGQEIMKGGLVRNNEMEKQTAALLDEYKLDYQPNTKVEKLSVAHLQMLEIIKAVRRNADIIIMDEPTSSLTDSESQKLFSIIKELVSKNVSVIYISHRLEEVLSLSDRITVLRDGELIKTVSAKDTSKNALVEMMVGRALDQIYPKEAAVIGEEILSVSDFSDGKNFSDINFSVRAGEILGISGLVGAGRSEIMNSIFGLAKVKKESKIRLFGKEITIKRPRDAIDKGIALLSEDRKMYGLVLCRSIKENMTLPSLKYSGKGPVIFSKKEKSDVDLFVKNLNIKCSSRDVVAHTLSGGNQQKVVLAKWLMRHPRVLILDEPTRGIDVGAKFEIYKMMVALVKQGIAIILISSELPEIIGMSDRILVVSNGRITNEYLREDLQSGKVSQRDLLKSALRKI